MENGVWPPKKIPQKNTQNIRVGEPKKTNDGVQWVWVAPPFRRVTSQARRWTGAVDWLEFGQIGIGVGVGVGVGVGIGSGVWIGIGVGVGIGMR